MTRLIGKGVSHQLSNISKTIVTDETNVWIAGGISPWEMNGSTSELDRRNLTGR